MESSLFTLNLEDESNQLLLPSFAKDDLESLSISLKNLGIKNHFLLSSSGTGGADWKGYLISKDSLLYNARAVNERLELTSQDRWGASLPYYHIGGLAIYLRANLLGHIPVDLRPWNPNQLVAEIQRHHISVISLVPAQVYDLVELNIKAPNEIRKVLIGGDFLGPSLESKFKDLGWPVVRTFGMSEVSSQLCTGMDEEGFYFPLPIHELKIDHSQNILVKSQSFFSYLVKKRENWELTSIKQYLDQEGFFKLPDKGLMSQGKLKVLGRDDGQIKTSGHLVNIIALKETLERFCLEHQCWGKMELQTIASEREGLDLVLHYLESVPELVIHQFLDEIRPVRIKNLEKHAFFERTDLGKFKTPRT
jgi:O-succinylbenzoic acid--CoA ligase